MNYSLQHSLQKKATQVEKATNTMLEVTQDWQTIRQYLCNRLAEHKLTPKQQEKLERYQYAYNQLVSGRYIDRDIINQLMNIYKIKDIQAYEDLNCTREIFSTVFNINKRFEQRVELEAARSSRRKCEEIGNYKDAQGYSKIIASLIKEVEEIEDNPADLFEGHIIEATFDPTLLGAAPIDKAAMKDLLNTLNEKRNVKIKIDMFEELTYTDIPEDGSNQTAL